jgi:hypothetical protein
MWSRYNEPMATFKDESRFHGTHVKVGSGKVRNYFLSVVFFLNCWLCPTSWDRGIVEMVFDW